jgi:hypothetical protein
MTSDKLCITRSGPDIGTQQPRIRFSGKARCIAEGDSDDDSVQ